MVQLVSPRHMHQPHSLYSVGSRGSHSDTHHSFSSSSEGWNLVLDDLTLDSEGHHHRQSQHEHPIQSWQEEAHWMSFRHAVQQFATLRIQAAVIPEIHRDHNSDDSYKDDGDRQAAGEGQEGLVGQENLLLQRQDPESGRSPAALESDLAETKMRLALAQAERDELEFVLFQQQQHGTANDPSSPSHGLTSATNQRRSNQQFNDSDDDGMS